MNKKPSEQAGGADGAGGRRRALHHFHLEGAARDVVVAPLDNHQMVAAVLDHVVHLVQVAAQVLDEHFVAGSLRTVHAGVDQVVAWKEAGKNKVNGLPVRALRLEILRK